MKSRSFPLRCLTGAVLFALAGAAAAQQNTTYRYQYDAVGNLTKCCTQPTNYDHSYDGFTRCVGTSPD
jgi:hypothetical protein